MASTEIMPVHSGRPQWLTSDGQQQAGPFAEADVVRMIADGRLRAGHASVAGSGQWIPLRSHPAFAQALDAKSTAATSSRPVQSVARRKPIRKGLVALAICTVCVVMGSVAYAQLFDASDDVFPEVDAAVIKVTHSKKKKTLAVRIRIKTKGIEGLDFEVRNEKSRRLRPAKGNKKKVDAKGRITLKLDLAKATPGKHVATIRVQGDNVSGALLDVPYEVPEPPPHLESTTNALVCSGRTCRADLVDGSVNVSAPAGTEVTVGDKKIAIEGEAVYKVDAGMDAWLQTVDPTSLATAKTEVSVAFAFKDGTKLSGKIPMSGRSVDRDLQSKLDKVSSNGVAFPLDDAAPNKPRIIAKINSGISFFGRGQGLKSIDLVAKLESKPRSGSCGSYRNTSTGSVVTVEKTMYDKKVVVYDRRTGRVKTSRLFRASPPSCPTTMSSKSSVSSFVSQSDIDRYLKSLL